MINYSQKVIRQHYNKYKYKYINIEKQMKTNK